jgi:hypothetical protein
VSFFSDGEEIMATPPGGGPANDPNPSGSPNPFTKLSTSITFVGTIISVVAAGTALLGSCDTRRAQSFKSFREAVSSEETYWKGLYTDYQEIFTKDFDDRQAQRQARIRAIYTLAQRQPATFGEFSVPDLERTQASAQVAAMKTSLLNALTDTDPALAAELRARVVLARAGEQPAAAPNAPSQSTQPAATPATPPPPPPPPATPSNRVVELSPAHASGWDVDLFWCRGPNQDSNYQRALAIGNGFASFATSGRTIAPSVALGRVRIRPAARQQPPGPASNFNVVYDSGPGEAEAGAAVLATIAGVLGSGPPQFRLVRSNGTPTRWLISAFVCPPPSAAPAPARARPGRG